MIDLASLNPDFAPIVKVVILLLMGAYILFVTVTVAHIRALRRIVLIEKSLGSSLIQTIAIMYLLATISLFLAAVVIL